MATVQTLTPADVAARHGVDVGKVLAWIHAGELTAINVAESKTGRPRWRIDPADLERFEQGRRNTPPSLAPQPLRRRKSHADVREYF